MMSFLVLLAAPAAQAGMVSNSVSPRSVSVTTYPPPPTVINAVGNLPAAPKVITPPAPRPIYVIDLNVTAGTQELYSGTMRVAPGSQSTYEESLNQPLGTVCQGVPDYEAQERSSFRIILSLWPDPIERTHINVSWNRAAAEKDGCRTGATRTVQLTDAVMLQEGKTVVVEGDAGLKVTLSRRR